MMGSRRFRVVGITAVLVVVLVAVFVSYSYLRPPLDMTGGVTGITGKVGDEVNVGWDLRNNGWFPVRITEVEIDGYGGAVPVWTVGAVGHGMMVGSSMARLPQEDGYLLFPLGSFTVPPQRSLPQSELPGPASRTMTAPHLYGLISLYGFTAEGSYPVARTVTIRYRYLGLPMSHTYTFKE